MSGRKSGRDGKVYEHYSPYPLSIRDTDPNYKPDQTEPGKSKNQQLPSQDPFDDFDLAGDHGPTDWTFPQSPSGTREHPIRPLPILESLFAERLEFLRAALDELRRAENERDRMSQKALEDIDSRIEQCEQALRLYRQHPLNDFERRKHLERQLSDLKRQRRQEAVMSWRDLLNLRREIRRLQREIRSVGNALPDLNPEETTR